MSLTYYCRTKSFHCKDDFRLIIFYVKFLSREGKEDYQLKTSLPVKKIRFPERLRSERSGVRTGIIENSSNYSETSKILINRVLFRNL